MRDIISDIKSINVLNPIDWYKIFYKHRLIHFLFVGGSGVLINLLITGILTEFLFGREDYFYAYLVGLFANLTYNFLLYTFFAFRTKNRHYRRYLAFIVYSLLMTSLQASVVGVLVPVVGLNYYLAVIASVILFFSLFNFFVFKLWLFKNK